MHLLAVFVGYHCYFTCIFYILCIDTPFGPATNQLHLFSTSTQGQTCKRNAQPFPFACFSGAFLWAPCGRSCSTLWWCVLALSIGAGLIPQQFSLNPCLSSFSSAFYASPNSMLLPSTSLWIKGSHPPLHPFFILTSCEAYQADTGSPLMEKEPWKPRR